MVVVDMPSRIESELKGQEISKIKELNLDNCKADLINGLTNEFVELESLSLKNMGLTSLKGFPALPKLHTLELNDNCLSNGLESLLVCPGLTHLNLSGNKLDQLDALKPLAQLTNLTHLKLHNGEIEMKEDYRDEVFKRLTNLKYLDGFDVNEQEEDDEEYSDESDDDDDDEEEDEELEDDEKSEPGLSYLQKSNLAEEEESDDEEFNVDKVEKKSQQEGDEAMDTEMQETEEPAAAEEEDSDEESESDEPGTSYLLKSNLAEEEPDDEEFDVEKEMEKEPSNGGDEEIDEEYESGDDDEEEKILDQDDEISRDNILDEACSRRKRNNDPLRQQDNSKARIEKQL